ncbi:MAG TPA: hypothetical protein VKE74_28310 [Gemmataceae bacterium]|nr:hypothetical protein [Gemmataceae bacterium]
MFSMTEPDAYGVPTVILQMTYKIVGASLEEMLQASGLWRPVPGSDEKERRTSLAGVLGPRGVAGLVFTTADDFLVDLCQSTFPVVPPGGRG